MQKISILINAISIKEGGSLVVLSNLLKQMAESRPDIIWYVAVSRGDLVDKKSRTNNVKLLVFPWIEKSAFHLLYWYEIVLLEIIKKYEFNFLLSLTNYLPRRKIGIKTLLLVQHAGYFSKKFYHLMKQDSNFFGRLLWNYKKKWIMNSIRNTNCLTIQTETLKAKIEKFFPELKMVVIPHGAGLILDGHNEVVRDKSTITLGYITKYGVQKNFGVIIEAMTKLVALNIPVRLILTLDKNINEIQPIMAAITKNNLNPYVINFGEIPQTRIAEIYKKVDIFLFPSLVESFGMPMVEAMSMGLPIIAADTAVNREILGPNALLFEPDNSTQLGEMIQYLLNNTEALNTAIKNSLEQSKLYSWTEAARLNLSIIDDLLLKKSVMK